MDLKKIAACLLYISLSEALVLQRIDKDVEEDGNKISSDTNLMVNEEKLENITDVFDGVYTECLLSLSYPCLQKKTLMYLRELNELNEVPVIGNYVKFVKVNDSENEGSNIEMTTTKTSDELSYQIDKAVDKFFNNHLLKINALGKNITLPRNVEDFVGRKRKGGDDGGKKKMMMVAMMCMKMKLMVMLPAMMGMMGMMSFKGMMFSMMSFMMTKMMLLMKILEKKGGGGGGHDGGWSSGGGGGAWMPAGSDYGGSGGYDANGQWQSRSYLDDQLETTKMTSQTNQPMITYIKPVQFSKSAEINKPYSTIKIMNDEVLRLNQEKRNRRNIDFEIFNDEVKDNDLIENQIDVTKNSHQAFYKNPKSKRSKRSAANLEAKNENLNDVHSFDEDEPKSLDRKTKSRDKRDVIDMLRSAYYYLINRFLGVTATNRKYQPLFYPRPNLQGIKYVYVPVRFVPKVRTPKELVSNEFQAMESGFKPIIQTVKPTSTGGFDPIVATEDFNKGEIVEGAVVTSRSFTDFNRGDAVEEPVETSRSLKKKMKKFKDTVNEVIDEDPWE